MGSHTSTLKLEPEVKHRKISELKLTHYEEHDGKNRKFSLEVTEFDGSRKRKHTTVCLDEVAEIDICRASKEVVKYCLPLLTAHFVGQTNSSMHTDQVDDTELGHLHLGVYLQLMDDYLRQFETVHEFTGTDDFYLKLLSYVAVKRRMPGESESEAYTRLLADSKRFVEIYHKRGMLSQELKDHKNYWGSRQQLLSAKVISDWVDKDNGPLDPIFGALLQPTTGRAGPGDSGWFHQLMFDGDGHVAYHSAVHDAFGYLLNYHNIGPGYDYMDHSRLSKSNPLAGQLDGMSFWKTVIGKVQTKENERKPRSGSLDFPKDFPTESRRNTVVF